MTGELMRAYWFSSQSEVDKRHEKGNFFWFKASSAVAVFLYLYLSDIFIKELFIIDSN